MRIPGNRDKVKQNEGKNILKKENVRIPGNRDKVKWNEGKNILKEEK